MKVVAKERFSHVQLTSRSTGENFSLSQVVSGLLGSQQLFVHHDIVAPQHRSSGAHRHSVIEEIVYILKGTATVVSGQMKVTASEGSFVLFDPKDKETHFLVNRTENDIETITFSISSQYDMVIYEGEKDPEFHVPDSHFDEDLRDIPDNREEWESFFEMLKSQINSESHAEKKLMLFAHAGMTARKLMKLDEAEFFLQKAVTFSYGHPLPYRLLQNQIRLAHVYQWKREFEKAQLLFDQVKSLLDETTVSESLRAAYHQHLGKLYFDQEYYGKAQAEFATGLSIRQKISAPEDQINSSTDSLKEALKRWGRNFPTGTYVRRAVPSDAEAIHQAHMKSIQEICAKDYSPEEIQAWGHRPYREDHRVGSIKNDLVWVIEDFGSIEGYGHLKIYEKDNLKCAQILGLYLTPQVTGKSLGKAIIDVMMEEIRAVQVKSVSLEATITAKDFYGKMGFVQDGPAMTVEIRGTQIRCFPMKMKV